MKSGCKWYVKNAFSFATLFLGYVLRDLFLIPVVKYRTRILLKRNRKILGDFRNRKILGDFRKRYPQV
jgi:hypothetical protein